MLDKNSPTARECPFCGGPAVIRADSGREAAPFLVRCDAADCAGYNPSQAHATPELALAAWNARSAPAEAPGKQIAALWGFTTRSLMRGEMVGFALDSNGVLTSDAIEINRRSMRLMQRPQ